MEGWSALGKRVPNREGIRESTSCRANVQSALREDIQLIGSFAVPEERAAKLRGAFPRGPLQYSRRGVRQGGIRSVTPC